MSTPIIIDEWLFHDLSGENGDEKQEQTFLFLFKLLKICDRIVILKGSPFEVKLWKFMKDSGRNSTLRMVSKFLQDSIISNSLKTLWIEQDGVEPLPVHLARLVPAGDQYLFQAHLKVKSSFILTTDGRWHRLMKQKSLCIKMRDDFLGEYMTRIQ